MGRILGIDFGKKRIGLAVTDPMQMFASPLTTVDTRDFDTFLEDYLSKEKVDGFAVGYPVQMNNTPSESVRSLEPFLGRLKKKYPDIPVYLVDERFTSKIAFRSMIDGGVKKEKRKDKSMIDRISASIILQSWLDNKQNKRI